MVAVDLTPNVETIFISFQIAYEMAHEIPLLYVELRKQAHLNSL